MSVKSTPARPKMKESLRPYGRLSLIDLAGLIAYHSDREALCELHDHRSIFRAAGERPVRLTEFIDWLRQSAAKRFGWGATAREYGYDLTVDKFSNLPGGDPRAPKSTSDRASTMNSAGPNCCLYYEAYHRRLKKIGIQTTTSQIERDTVAAQVLRSHVYRHFKLSCQEWYRTRSFVKRYFWKVNGQTLAVFMPSDMPGRECGDWLANNINDPDLPRPLERDHVQAVVNERLARRKIVSLSKPGQALADTLAFDQVESCSIAHDISVKGLASAVAEEKADNLEGQRPAIRSLGKNRLMRMIIRIFEDVSNGDYNDSHIAIAFGLSKATFSRFAGSRWNKPSRKTEDPSIPDLWLNTAQTLAAHRDFVEAAKAVGVWRRVEEIAHNGEGQL